MNIREHFNLKTTVITLVTLGLVAGGSGAIADYIGLTETDAKFQEPLEVTVQENSDLDTSGAFEGHAGEAATLDLGINNVADTDAPRFVRVLEVSRRGHDYTGLDQARDNLDVQWELEGTNGYGVAPMSANMLSNSYEDGWQHSGGHIAAVQNGDVVVCNAHADDGWMENNGDYLDERYDITPEYFGGDATYDVDYKIQDECPVSPYSS